MHLLRREAIDGGALEAFPRSKDSGGKVRFVWRVGKMLRFKCECPAMAVRFAAFPFRRSVQKVAGVELHPGLCSEDLENPVRRVLNYASHHFASALPIFHILTVIGNDGGGLFIGDDLECFERACGLSLRLNVTLLDRPVRKLVVYLDAAHFRSTWLGK